MADAFHDREKSFEAKYRQDQEFEFKITARRNKLLGEWLAGETLISEILSDQGYRVGLFGKWHATTQGWKPVRGFHRWLTYDERAANWINQYQHSGTVYFSSDGEGISHSGVQARFLSESAVDFISEFGLNLIIFPEP